MPSLRDQLNVALRTNDDRILSTCWSADEGREIFSSIRHIIADADGTILEVGGTEIRPSQLRKIRMLAEQGVQTVILTGKSLQEAMAMFENVDASIPLSVLCEKGAYRIVRGPKNSIKHSYHLSSRDVEKQASRLSRIVEAEQASIESKYQIRMVPAGDGQHESLLSIDIMRMNLPDDYADRERSVFKITDRTVVHSVKEHLRSLLDQHDFDDWKITDLGNGNIEIHPSFLSKSAAVERELADTDEPALLLGDSGNDRDMFTEAVKRPHTYTGLVYHAHTPDDLADHADFGTSRVAMGERYFSSILHARAVPEGLFVATNTPPFGYNSRQKRLDVKVGMPVAIAELVGAMQDCRWVFVGDDDFSGEQRISQLGLRGKLVPVSIPEETRNSHYKHVSNQQIWPGMHKPEALAPVRVYEPEEERAHWMAYREVCRMVAGNLYEQAADFHAQPENDHSTAAIWVHDYQMIAVGEYFRRRPPLQGKSTVGFSWHIPFPPAEIFLQEMGEERTRQIMEWFARYDAISFHTRSYADNYAELCAQLDIPVARTVIEPISVNVQEVRELTRHALEPDHRFSKHELHRILDINGLNGEHADLLPATQDAVIGTGRAETRHVMRVILGGVERCDDTKGCIDRLQAWAEISLTHPELFKDVKVIEVLVRSREGIPLYDELYARIEELVKEIESNVGRKAVIHVDRINEREDVIAAMAKADTVVVTPRRDGYNMVAAEMSAVLLEKRAQGDPSGNLLISQGMGFYESLVDDNMPDAVDSFPGEVTADSLVEPLKRALRGEVRDVDADALERYFARHTLSAWSRAMMQELMRQSFERDYAGITP